MLRTGTASAIPQKLLHGGEVARCPQAFAVDGACEGLERGLGTPPIAYVLRDASEPQQHAPCPTVSAGEEIVQHRFRPLRESRRRRVRRCGIEVASRSRVGEIALQQPHEVFGNLAVARLARGLAGRDTPRRPAPDPRVTPAPANPTPR